MSIYNSLKSLTTWKPTFTKIKLSCIDMHTGGEPLRIIIEGYPKLLGKTILDKRREAKDNYDHIRTQLMYEPRGHSDMYGAIITESERTDSDFGVLFIHNEGYSTMCGHAIIALTTFMFETGLKENSDGNHQLKIDAPAGQITSYASVRNKKVTSVKFHNVPSFVDELNATVDVPELGVIKYDLAFGGGFYAYVNSSEIGISCTPENTQELISKGMQIKHAVMKSREITHPIEEDLGFLYGTIFIDKDEYGISRNCCIFAEGEVDRSPTGTGVSGRMAIHHAKGEIKIGEEMIIKSIIGSSFKCSVLNETTFGKFKAIIPEVTGSAFFTGKSEYYIDSDDELKNGFLLR